MRNPPIRPGFEAIVAKKTEREQEQPSSETEEPDRAKTIAEVLANTPKAMAVLRAKATEDEVHAYGSWLIETAVKVCESAKTDGKKVTEAEQKFIVQLTAATKA